MYALSGRSLVKVRQIIGERDFNHILAKCNPQCLQDFTILCQVYEVTDYMSTPLDMSQPLGFLSYDQPETSSTSHGLSSDDYVPGPSRARSAQRNNLRATTPSPGRSGSQSPRRSKSPSPTRPMSSKPQSRPTSGRSISVDRPKSRTNSGASSSFSQPGSDFEDDGLFIRGKSAGSMRSDRVGTGRRVRFGGESELKTPSPIVLLDDDLKENVSPKKARRPSAVEVVKPSQIPIRIRTENGPQVSFA